MRFEDDKVTELAREWFAKTADREWRRLEKDAYHQIEFIVTMHFLKKYLPRRGLILDAGGGPGRYTIELARRGYHIVLLDFVPEMLTVAKRRIKKARVEGKVEQLVQGSVEDLSMFNDDTFDGVACLGGPLNHLLRIEQREKATSELVRVAKKGAPIFVSVIGRLGLLRTLLVRFQNEMAYAEHHWRVGDYIPGLQGKGFTAAHWFLPEELHGLFKEESVEVLEMAGLEGLSSHYPRETNRLHKDKEKWDMWLEVLIETCTHPAVVGSSEHFLFVVRKSS
jgi:ubiquinone/menaquinone biosynthesis C-methylase UbiE